MFKRELAVSGALGRRFLSQSRTVLNELSEASSSSPQESFVDYPKFEPLGNPASLINVTLPASTVLNLRSNSVLAANGDLNNITSKLSVLKLLTKPLIYNQISSITPLSLILSNKGSKDYFINLELAANDQWKIFNTKNLVAWYGQDLSISNSKVGIQVDSGNGSSNVILNGKNQLFTLNLDQNETIYLNPKSIIAINSSQDNAEFTKLQSSTLSSISIPQFKIWDSLKINFNHYYQKLIKSIESSATSDSTKQVKATQDALVSKPKVTAPATTPEGTNQIATKSNDFQIPQSFKSIGTWIYNKFNNFYLNDKLFYEVKGPATIIIQNSTSNRTSQIFTNEQLKDIYKNL